METLQRRDDAQFQAEIDNLIREAEERRFAHMKRHSRRAHFSTAAGILSVIAGACAFGWYLLMQYDLAAALLCMGVGIVLPLLLLPWVGGPVKKYVRDYKKSFMPQLAHAFGGLQFHEARGISAALLAKTGVIPEHDTYNAEDCFMGSYKGVKVIFSEARLTARGKREPVFAGVMVLLEIPGSPLEGHTIITSDAMMIKNWATTRWKKLQPVGITVENPALANFKIFSDTPDAAKLFVGERLLKELAEASAVFGQSPLTAVMFRQKYIFIAIPHEENMFEASNMFLPVASKTHALQCKREIERIMEIIDVFELYKPKEVGKFGL
jgi:hypothetical protein